MYLTPPLKGFPLELGMGAWGQKTRMMDLRLTMFLTIWMDSIHDRDGQTDRRTLADSVAR